VGEYYGLYKALQYLIDNGLNDNSIIVEGDSKMVINQMTGKWKVKKGYYKDLAKKVIALKPKFKSIRYYWIPREENEWADGLSKKAIEGDKLIYSC